MSDDEFDVDFDDDDFDDGGSEVDKPSLKDIWDNNPLFKVISMVMALGVIIGAIMIFTSDNAEEAKSILMVNGGSGVKHIPGKEDLDPIYRKALQESNKQTAQLAAKTGGSALPTPIGKSKNIGLDLPKISNISKSDPLAEWRKATRLRRMKAKESIDRGDEGDDSSTVGIVPSIVPMVKPIRPKTPTIRRDPNASKALEAQMRVILAAQAPLQIAHLDVTLGVKSEYEKHQDALKNKENNRKKRGTIKTKRGIRQTFDKDVTENKVIVNAGSISYAQTITSLNSDILGPVLAQILSGPFAGARIIGSVSVKDDYMVLEFQRIVKDDVSYSVSAVGMDKDTTLTGQVTSINHHYYERVILPAAAKFISGYANALSQTGTSTTVGSGGATTANNPIPSPKQSIYGGLNASASTISKILLQDSNKPLTIKIAKGTTFGIIFTEAVTTGDIEQ